MPKHLLVAHSTMVIGAINTLYSLPSYHGLQRWSHQDARASRKYGGSQLEDLCFMSRLRLLVPPLCQNNPDLSVYPPDLETSFLHKQKNSGYVCLECLFSRRKPAIPGSKVKAPVYSLAMLKIPGP